VSRLLGLLREPGEGRALAPRPSLDRAEALVETVRETGLPVELRVEGDAVPLPSAVDVSAYRVLQEALTNVVKHAGPARARAVVRYGRTAVEIEVSDDGRGANGAAATGYGLAGMRERVELHGGTLDTGAPAGGGFVVKARIPYDER